MLRLGDVGPSGFPPLLSRTERPPNSPARSPPDCRLSSNSGGLSSLSAPSGSATSKPPASPALRSHLGFSQGDALAKSLALDGFIGICVSQYDASAIGFSKTNGAAKVLGWGERKSVLLRGTFFHSQRPRRSMRDGPNLEGRKRSGERRIKGATV